MLKIDSLAGEFATAESIACCDRILMWLALGLRTSTTEGEKRILLVLPYGENSILSATEVIQESPDQYAPSDEEIDYLIASFKRCFRRWIARQDIINGFSGIRRVVSANTDISQLAANWPSIAKAGWLKFLAASGPSRGHLPEQSSRNRSI